MANKKQIAPTGASADEAFIASGRPSFDRALLEKHEAIAAIPDAELFTAAKERYAARRAELGPYFNLKVIRTCNGCGKAYSAREMRTHKCTISWKKR